MDPGIQDITILPNSYFKVHKQERICNLCSITGVEHLLKQNIRLFHIVTNDETLVYTMTFNVNSFQITVKSLVDSACADIYEKN